MILYHGSKAGISGEVRPDAGRKSCDFGQGFYAGDKRDQPVSLIAGFQHATLYTVECSLEGLNVLEFHDDYDGRMDWALFVAYNRKILDFSSYPKLVEKFESYLMDYDVICGAIANDKMTIALNMFYRGLLCDKALLNALEYVSLGNQYVFRSRKACQSEHIKVIDSHVLSDAEKNQAKIHNEAVFRQNRNLMEQLQTRYRRASDVLFYDEVLEARRNSP